jgi:hypothetical protein
MNDWNSLARALRQLHAALLGSARDEYMRDHGLADPPAPGELLMLATQDEGFAWLRSLSELMAQIDELADDAQATADPQLRAAVRGAVEQLLAPAPGDAGNFAANYGRHLHAHPDTVMAHAAVKQALQAWPKPLAKAPALAQHVERTRGRTRR